MTQIVDWINSGIEFLKACVPADFVDYFEAILFVLALATIVVAGIIALYSYKLFRIELVIEGVLLFGILGGAVFGPWLESTLTFVPESVNVSAILGFALAIIGGLMMHFLLKFALFVTGAAAGWFTMYVFGLEFLNAQFPGNEFLTSDVGIILLPILSAIVVGVLFIFLFKFLYIILTSFGGMCTAALIAGFFVAPQGGMITLIASLAVGAIAGICATVYQYRSNSRYRYYIMK